MKLEYIVPGYVGGVIAAAYAYDKYTDFFYAPYGWQGVVPSRFDIWKQSHYNRYLDVKIGTKSFIRSGGLKTVAKTGLRRLGYVGYAITAVEAASAYRDDGLSGVADYAFDSYERDMRFVLPFSAPLFDIYHYMADD